MSLLIGQLFTRDVAGELGMSSVARTLLYWACFPFAAALLLAVVAFLYWAAPNAKMPFRWVTPGALVFIVAWIAFTVGFGFYVANFGSYNSTYGTLGGVVVLMVWLYLSSFILLAAAELNSIVFENAEPQEAPASRPAAPAGQPGDRPSRTPNGEAPPISPGAATMAPGAAVAARSAWRALREPPAEEDGADTSQAEHERALR